MKNSNDLAVIILAAGMSKRLGSCKQLINYKGETLLKRAVKKALKLSDDVFVVLGYEKDKCEKELKTLNITTIFNKDYEKGMGSSISCGIQHTQNFKNTMILLCDQPFIPLSHLKTLSKKIDNKSIITSLYSNNLKKSVPAIFPNIFYNSLLKLDGDFGAKYLLKDEKTIDIKLEKEFTIDIDTKEDKKLFLN